MCDWKIKIDSAPTVAISGFVNGIFAAAIQLLIAVGIFEAGNAASSMAMGQEQCQKSDPTNLQESSIAEILRAPTNVC